MIQCTSCARHHRASETSCPFCGASISPAVFSPAVNRVLGVMGAGVTAMVLAACYGSPSDKPYGDHDADGWYSDEDCADMDVTINPDAEEICDDTFDNDCDGDIDEDDEDCDGDSG